MKPSSDTAETAGMQRETLAITGMTCANCAAAIHRTLQKKVPGVVDATVNYATEKATVEGTSGEWDQNTDMMLARGDVLLVVHRDGRRIESAEINYDPAEDKIWSDSATVQTLANGRVTRGSAFESDMEFQNVRILNIRGAIAR